MKYLQIPLGLACALFLVQASITQAQAPASPAQPPTSSSNTAKSEVKPDKDGWIDLIIDSKLEGWEKTNFGGEGAVEFKDGQLILDNGHPLTGIHYKKEFPKENFEIRFEANRLEGSDFLVGLTFPVGNSYLSLIGGGWGGGVTGLSSIDGSDASENETTSVQPYKNNQWYRFRLRVDSQKVQAWLDDKNIVDVERAGKDFSIRAEVRPSRPLGYAVFDSRVAVRNFQYRPISSSTEKK